MQLGEMNWPDVQELDKERLVAVYPIASFEQHGLHLPLLTDTIETTGIVARLDQRIPEEVVCLPTQWLGYSFHHMRFDGSLTATSDTHINLVVETVAGLISANFKNILILNGHGGNQSDLRVALQKLKERYPDVRVCGASWWEVAAPELDDIREAGPDGWGHAGEMETSMMMVLRPDLVKADRLHVDGTKSKSLYESRVVRFQRMDEYTTRGNYGDPTVASVEKGERMLDAVVQNLVELVRDIQNGQL